jgi:hypothetical protein
MDIASPERHEVLGELTFRKGSIKVQCSSSTRRSSSRRRRHGTTSSSCHVLPTAMARAMSGRLGQRTTARVQEQDTAARLLRCSVHATSSTRRRRMPATSSHRRCRSGRRPSVSSSLPSCEQPASGQRSAPTARRGTVDAYCIAMGSGWAWVGHRKGQAQFRSKTKLILILINYLGALRSV